MPILDPNEWSERTGAGRLHPRSALLRAVDTALAGLNRTHNVNQLHDALNAWKDSKPEVRWRNGIRNQVTAGFARGAIDELTDEISQLRLPVFGGVLGFTDWTNPRPDFEGRTHHALNNLGEPMQVPLECSERVGRSHNHVVLPYAVGHVNYTDEAGDVISGCFTGCFMTVYETPDSRRRVGHVATGGDGRDCKQGFNDMMATEGHRLIGHFRPFDQHAAGDLDGRICDRYAHPAGDGCIVLGRLTAGDRCSSIFMRRSYENPARYEVAEVLPRDLQGGPLP